MPFMYARCASGTMTRDVDNRSCSCVVSSSSSSEAMSRETACSSASMFPRSSSYTCSESSLPTMMLRAPDSHRMAPRLAIVNVTGSSSWVPVVKLK